MSAERSRILNTTVCAGVPLRPSGVYWRTGGGAGAFRTTPIISSRMNWTARNCTWRASLALGWRARQSVYL